ncbi:MAG: DUF2783 domain-containing protein [Burkholderiaceae bacterium]|nr:DUF2783 domain-containing protein [Burkholderiaceae bacterium]
MKTNLQTQLRIADPDGFYEKLLDAHRGLNDEQCAQFDARLILLLANQVGDDRVLAECIEAAARPFARAAR